MLNMVENQLPDMLSWCYAQERSLGWIQSSSSGETLTYDILLGVINLSPMATSGPQIFPPKHQHQQPL